MMDDGDYEAGPVCGACGLETGTDTPCCDEEVEAMAKQDELPVWVVDFNGVHVPRFMGDNVGAAEKTRGFFRWLQQATGAHIIAACDAPGRKHRHDIDPEYKANRDEPPPGLVGSLRNAKRMLDADGFHLLQADGFEGDDVIATVVEWLAANSRGAVVVSDDKDMGQLVRPGVMWYRPYKDREGTLEDGMYRTAADVERDFGVPPDAIGDLLTLQGDSSDNIPGAKGVGEKTAVKLLRAFTDLPGLHHAISAQPDKFTPKRLENLQAFFADTPDGSQASISRQLVTLRADAITPEQCAAAMQPKEPTPIAEATDHFEGLEEPMTDDTPDPADTMPGAPSSVPEVEGEAIPAPASAPRGLARVRNDYGYERGLEPQTIRAAFQLAESVCRSRLSAYGSPDEVLAIILMGRSFGLGAWDALRGIHNLKGKPTMSAQLMVGLVMGRKDLCEYFALVESSTTVATYETKRIGWPTPTRLSFTIEDAKRAELLRKGGNWAKYPAQMLRARCSADLARAVYPDVLHNVYTPGELGGVEEVAA